MTRLTMSTNLVHRPRRNRASAAIRDLVQETRLHPSDFVAPLFVLEGHNTLEPVVSMPGVQRMSVDLLIREVEELISLGIRSVDLFPVVPSEKKDAEGSEALNPSGLMPTAVRMLKQEFPELDVMVDVALDPYTSYGHDGVLNEFGQVDNDASVEILGKMCVMLAEAGVDRVAPSDMMDGRVGHIRKELDQMGASGVGIISYTAKYASALYGPFREALSSAPKSGDKKGYQMNPANGKEAILEAMLDESEGADMLMVKPATLYLDVIKQISEQSLLPVAAYHVSGEYSAVMAADSNGWLDASAVFYESLLAIKRAGASCIFTYAWRQVLPLIK